MLKVGSLVDRRDPRLVMGSADAVRAAALLVVAVTAIVSHPPVVMVVGSAVIIGAGQAFFDTSYSAVLPRLLEGPPLAGANSLYGQSQYLAFCLGPPLAGLLIRAVGGGQAVALDAASFVFSGTLVLMLGRSLPRPAPEVLEPALADASENAGTQQRETRKPPSAVGFVWRNAQLRAVAFASATGNLGHQMVQGVYLVYVYRSMHLGSGFVGIAFGIGSAAGIAGARPACGCRKPMPPGDIRESRLQRGHAAGCGSGPSR